MTSKYDLTICIVAYNTKALIRSCLNSIEKQTKGISYQIILVDNASKDGTAEMIEKDFANVLLIKSPKNLGFPSACNLALEKANSRHFVLFNSDTELLNDAFTNLVDFMDQNPTCGISCPQLYYPDGRVQTSHYPFRDPKSRAYWELYPRIEEIKLLFGKSNPKKEKSEKVKSVPSEPTEVERPRGVCFMISMACVREIGPMDGNFFIFSDEVDWAYRAKKAGWKRFIVPSSRVQHLDHASISKHATLMVKVEIQSMYYYNYKHFGFLAWLRIRFGYVLSALLAYFLYVLTSLVGNKGSEKSSEDHLLDSQKLFVLAFLTKKVLPPDAV